MRALGVRALVFFGLQLSLLGFLLRDYHTDRRMMLSAANAKHARLRALPSPRLILVGGSNVLYGLDSPALAAETGIESVVNMALTAPLGLDYMLNDVQRYVRASDVVLLSPEYDHFCRDVTSARELIWLIERRPSAIEDFPADDFKLVMDRALHHLAAIVRAQVRHRDRDTHRLSVGDIRYINEYGDNVASSFVAPPPIEPSYHLDCEQGRHGLMQREVQRVARFARAVEARGGHVLLSYPTFEREEFEQARADISDLDKRLRRVLGDAVVTSPEETVIPRSALFDTQYHPNQREKTRRSRLVARRIYDYFRPGVEHPLVSHLDR